MKIVGLSVVLFASLALSVHADEPNTGAAKKPNIVFVLADDLGYGDIGPFGCKDIPTPNLDRLAREGVILTQSYAASTPCCPSRSSIMMGIQAQRFGKYSMTRMLDIPRDKPTMGQFMRDNGYVTGQCGKWDLGGWDQGPQNVGFMEVAKAPPLKKIEDWSHIKKERQRKELEKRGTSRYIYVKKDGTDGWLTEYEGGKLSEFVERNHDKPFFFYFDPLAVHSPNVEVPEHYMARTTAVGERRELAGQIVSLDDQIGKFLDLLDKYKLRENTLIIFSSDQGPQLLDEGGTAAPYRGGKRWGHPHYKDFEGHAHIPTIISWPGGLPEGKSYEGLSCSLDFYPTIVAAVGVKVPDHLDGVNLLPYLRGKKKGDAHEYLFWKMKHRYTEEGFDQQHIRWKDWRLVNYNGKWKLFDLKKDVREEKNIASKHPEVVKKMLKEYEAWGKTLAPPVTEIPPRPKGFKGKMPKGYGWLIQE